MLQSEWFLVTHTVIRSLNVIFTLVFLEIDRGERRIRNYFISLQFQTIKCVSIQGWCSLKLRFWAIDSIQYCFLQLIRSKYVKLSNGYCSSIWLCLISWWLLRYGVITLSSLIETLPLTLWFLNCVKKMLTMGWC